MEKIIYKLKEIIADVTENEEIRLLNEKINIFEEIGISSLQMIQMVVEIEEEFNIELDDSELGYQAFSTLEDLCKIVQNHI